jgi:hypothetical protein
MVGPQTVSELAANRFAIFATVALLQPVAAWMLVQLARPFSIAAIPSFLATFSARPL